MRLKNKLIIFAVVIALVAGGLAWWKFGKSTPQPDRVSIGSGLFAAGPDADELSAKPVKTVKTEKFVSKRLTKPYDVRVKGGKLSAPVTLWIPTTAKPGDPAMLASKHPGKPWDYFGPERGDVKIERIDGVNYLRATVPHLSIDLGFSPRDWITEQWHNVLRKTTLGIHIDTTPPKCRDQQTAGKLGYGLGVTKQHAVTACVGHHNGAAEVVVKSTKRYSLVVTHPGFKRIGSPAAQLSVAALGKFDTKDRTTLMPGDSVTLSRSLEVGKHGVIKAELDGWTQNLSRVDVAIRAIAQMYELIATGSKAKYAKIANLVLQSTDCTNAISSGNVADLGSSCFPPDLMEKVAKESKVPVDKTAVATDFGSGLSTWLVSELSSLETAVGGDRAEIWLNRHASKAPKYTLPHRCGEASSGGTVTILENSVSCEEALAVAAAYGRGAAQPRTITSKDCAKDGCVITGSWKCTTVSEGETECGKGTALIHNGSPITESFRGTWHTHNFTITITSGTKGRIDWGEVGSYSATFSYSTLGDDGFARITSSTLQAEKPNEYYKFKVGDYYTMKVDGYMLTMTNTEDPGDSVGACGRGHESDCGM